jgi:hypothetical protein
MFCGQRALSAKRIESLHHHPPTHPPVPGQRDIGFPPPGQGIISSVTDDREPRFALGIDAPDDEATDLVGNLLDASPSVVVPQRGDDEAFISAGEALRVTLPLGDPPASLVGRP